MTWYELCDIWCDDNYYMIYGVVFYLNKCCLIILFI